MAETFQSHFGPQLVNAAKYIAELMCVREAKGKGKELFFGFWNLDEWKRTYQTHIMSANMILKVYSAEAVVSALRQTPRVFSLRAKWFHDVIKKKQIEIDRKKALREENKPLEQDVEKKQIVIEKPRESFKTGKSAIDKLKDL